MLNSTDSLELSVDAYCTMSQIKAYMPAVRVLTSSSKPTLPQAIAIARDVYQEINGLLSVLGYVLPIPSSNTTGIRQVGRINALGAAADIEAAAYSSGNEEDSEHGRDLQAQYDAAWSKLESGSVAIIGAAREGAYLRRRNERKASASFDRDADNNERAPTFTKSMHW